MKVMDIKVHVVVIGSDYYFPAHGTLKAAALSEAFGRKLQAYSYGPPLHQAVNRHLMDAIGNTDFFEMEMSEGILDTPMRDSIALDGDGWVTILTKPGLGFDIDWERMDKLTLTFIE